MNNVRSIRLRLGVSQADLGAALGVTQSNVSQYEAGQAVRPHIAARLIEFARSRGCPLTFDDVYANPGDPNHQQLPQEIRP